MPAANNGVITVARHSLPEKFTWLMHPHWPTGVVPSYRDCDCKSLRHLSRYRRIVMSETWMARKNISTMSIVQNEWSSGVHCVLKRQYHLEAKGVSTKQLRSCMTIFICKWSSIIPLVLPSIKSCIESRGGEQPSTLGTLQYWSRQTSHTASNSFCAIRIDLFV